MSGAQTSGRAGSLLGLLREVGLFAGLSDATLGEIARVAYLQTFSPDEHILLKGEPCRAVYFVVEGSVRIYRVSPEGREQVLARLNRGQAFNTVPPFQDSGHSPANAVALTPVTLGVLPKEDFLRIASTSPEFAMAILRDFASRLTVLTNLVESLALYTVQERLARFLLEHVGDPAGEQPGAVVQRKWTQQDIAVHLGTVRDVIGRTLRAFEDAGLIRFERSQILLVDREELERIAGYR